MISNYKLKLIRGRSYTGNGISANIKNPIIETGNKQVADKLVAGKRFELIDVVEPNVNNEADNGVPNEKWSVAQLKDYAAANGVDLTGAKAKADILAKIQETGEENGNGVDFGENE